MDLTWFGWFLVALWVFGSFNTVRMVGKPRKPLDPDVAAFTVAAVAALIVGVFTVGVNG